VLVIALATCSALFFHLKVSATKKTISKELIAEYTQWRSKYQRLLSTPAELNYRIKVYGENRDHIREDNTEYEQYVQEKGLEPLTGPMFSVNQFADITEEEFTATYTGLNMNLKNFDGEMELKEPTIEETQSLGQQRDPFVPAIYQQGSCGSCWAFAAIAVAERRYWKLFGKRIYLSQQELLDCERVSGGCKGGLPHAAMDYMYHYDISQASQYPYMGAQYQCQQKQKVGLKGKIRGQAVTFNPTTINTAINSNMDYVAVVFYIGKVRFLSTSDDLYYASSSGECSMQPNHAVAVSETAGNYIRILNSWGNTWGYRGTKKMVPCDANNLLGKPAFVMYAP